MTDAPPLNRLWAETLVDELVRCGVGLFGLAPGSRSTPLALAVAASEAASIVHFDERGLAFYALGWARATGRPAAVVTTSGTAVANLLPAAVEASVDAVPLVLLTADRPPELRDTGANQTIRQPGLFGSYVRWQFDLPTPTPGIDLAFVRTTAAQAVHRATGRPAGPVHLNGPFREPFVSAAPPGLPANGQAGAAPYTRYAAATAVDPAALTGLADRLRGIGRGLVVAGRLRTPAEGEAAVRLAETLGWPLVPDVGSQVRLGAPSGVSCPHYDLLLGSDAFGSAHAPEAVVYLGGRSTSKRLAEHLAASRPRPFVVVRNDPFRFDPDHLVSDRVEADVAVFCDALVEQIGGRGSEGGWLASWRRASDAATETLDAYFSETGALSEPAVARAAVRHAGAGLVLAASRPVRDADAFAAGSSALVTANRGASGIDGTVATAAGFARGLGAPVTLLIGDLALLHDLPSLALLRGGPPVTVVAVNNDGGGIFHFLPIADGSTVPPDVFESAFGTPHGLGFEHAARMFGMGYHRPESLGALGAALGAARAQADGSVLIEARTERAANRRLHDDLLARVAAAVEATLETEAPR